ncbi:hypothetical protein [Salipaludibacillus daqingensis]|uniref:hypothetical protein n=1 Tax=Salipaludibacillus daqingensis TaxID=3041001 RepID=UPI002474CEFB|nr:hypothetical protein [Salipaludibacillus daqingensis]
MAAKQLDYFAGDHTAKGFYHFYSSNLQSIRQGIVCNGKIPSIKTDFMKEMANKWTKEGFDVEIIHSSSIKNGIDCVINRELSIAIYDGDLLKLEFQGTIIKKLDLDAELNQEAQMIEKESKKLVNERMNIAFQNAHVSFKKGLYVHDGLEEIYINNMDFHKLNKLAQRMTKDWLSEGKELTKKAVIKHRFFGAVTPKGMVDFIPQLTTDCHKRWLIKGRAGTGKSTLLKKVADEVSKKGYNVELYHCGFDPESIDMVVAREIGFCAFDSTPPHEYFPEREGDILIDIYEEAVEPYTDEKYGKAIEILTDRYKSFMKKGAEYLVQANKLNEEWEQRFNNSISMHKRDKLLEEVFVRSLRNKRS